MGKTIQVFGFPNGVSAEEVKNFLERLTGSGTVYAIKVRQPRNGGPRVFAIVQFTSERLARDIVTLASQRLNYGRSYLKAFEVEQDIVPKPRASLHNIPSLKMYFGCQVSPKKLSVFWSAQNVAVSFGTGMRKLHFSMSWCEKEYRLELPYENIWQIDLHSPQGRRDSKFLVIQVIGAPKIFEKEDQPVNLSFGLLDFYSDGSDEQWIRTTDFTSSSCISQSSAFCLELPVHLNVPDFRENFANYTEHEASTFVVEPGRSFSSNANKLVPVVDPPPGCYLPFEILFKVNTLVQNACVPGPALDPAFYQLLNPQRFDRALIDHCLEKLFHLPECCYAPARWLREEYSSWVTKGKLPQSPMISLDDGLVYMYRVQVTPTRVYFSGPEVNVSNRVLRHYSDYINNFLRISFVDEDLEKVRSMDLSPRSSTVRRTKLYERINSVLRDGIVIGDKRFEFLAFSSSQLRENSAWMFAPVNGITAADIRAWMGEFDNIRNVAKYAARLGQSFSSSRETLTVRRDEIEVIPDVEIRSSDAHYVFSDGIGKISAEFARRVAKKCGLTEFFPSAYQIRYGGYKGVVAVDPNSSKKLSLRRSMSKFESENTKLDVLAWSKYQPCYMNRQLITLLSTLGVEDNVFEKKQREVVNQLDAILTDPTEAFEALGLMAPGENTKILKELILCGYKPDAEPFLSMMLQNFRASKLLELRTKTRVFIPRGRSMMGCLDETRTLEYGQVVVQYTDPTRPGSKYIVTGLVVVAKNPCLHPGDVRVLQAVNVPALSHMVDCVVFPQKGPRPHPNECSGSDLDGDIYFVCWDPELIPTGTSEPMDYTPEPTQILDHDVTIEEIEEYFTNYIVNDSLGIIANAHTAFADKEPLKAFSDPCIDLARKFSIAVDFPKTGVAAEIPQHLYVKEYPDFMEKPDKPTYESNNVIGKLFREVKERAPPLISIKSFTLDVASKAYDKDMEVNGFEEYIDDAFFHKGNYDYKLGNLMDYYGIKTEAEILSGGIMRMSKSFTKRRDAESIGRAVRSLRKEALSWFNASDEEEEVVNESAKASAWYHVTYHRSYWGVYNEGLNRDHFLSFAWCVYDKLVRIKKANVGRRQRQEALERLGLMRLS
ncbi:PREDICTED: RNA-dependent RNA polymerase 1 [Brassica oleracea var. oleracea]|uniref:RNA-dependent RNA polymerase n=1 Tax=Brassica oleracea var. oleracea TaxID=109376 RepID=A0A0D3CA93_BRAOL|nr:PREDICTED: RNA-dependent RNA polymerase 1 [Brassica oleracea var. oleracea]XP_013585197.1 PREDICTED: RNA-dependent RNA polymerase 1 [Brassica oleracea var. oleracea]XP_013615245.1 PREDICTED: RNA-dependent RNA polymerase 1 [Brassica oleracea var. oleracea]